MERYNLLNVVEALLLADKVVINTFELGDIIAQTDNIINTLNNSSRSLFHFRSPEIRHAKQIARKVARELRRYAPDSDFLAGIEAPLECHPIPIKRFYTVWTQSRHWKLHSSFQRPSARARIWRHRISSQWRTRRSVDRQMSSALATECTASLRRGFDRPINTAKNAICCARIMSYNCVSYAACRRQAFCYVRASS